MSEAMLLFPRVASLVEVEVFQDDLGLPARSESARAPSALL